jgi:hypothetical protein
MMFATGYWPIAGTEDTTIRSDHADDYSNIEGVETGIYKDLDDVEVGGVKAKRGSISRDDYAGATVSVSSMDVPWNVWTATLSGKVIEVNGSLYLLGHWWLVIGITSLREDGAQVRCLTRRAR